MLVSRSAILPYSSAQMFAVVNDIEAYPQFLNWCKEVEVVERASDQLSARMHIAYGKLAFAFTTRNTQIENRQINLELIDGPFSSFSGEWLFKPLVDEADPLAEQTRKIEGCKISLQMDFNFERGLASVMMAKMFEKIATTQLDAFQQRAHQLYSVAGKTTLGGRS